MAWKGRYPKYDVGKYKGKYVVRKFTGLDHSWAEYSKPIQSFETKQEAEQWVKEQSNE